jgi:hypothetical protein
MKNFRCGICDQAKTGEGVYRLWARGHGYSVMVCSGCNDDMNESHVHYAIEMPLGVDDDDLDPCDREFDRWRDRGFEDED